MRAVLVVMAIGLAVLGGFVVVLLNVREKDQAGLEQLRGTVRELRAQLEDRERSIVDLKTSVDHLQSKITATPPVRHESKSDNSSTALSDLARRVADVGSTQAQILGLLQKVAAKTSGTEVPWTPAERQAALAVLEEAQKEHELKVTAGKKRVEDLRIAHGVPNEVAALPTERALSAPSAFWPYFEARRELEGLQLIVERLKLRLVQEQLDSKIQDKTKGP